jgi:hypothetical protein
MGPTDKIKVMALLDERDRLFEEARQLPCGTKGMGLSFEQAQLVNAAKAAHREALAMLAAEHWLYSAPPWPENLTYQGESWFHG